MRGMSIKNNVYVNTHYTRSINLERDADSIEVINAYIPTSRALKLFNRVAEGFSNKQAPRAWSLIGPYGSGKSSCSVFLSQLLSFSESDISKAALNNLQIAEPSIAKFFINETAGTKGYLKVLITGSPEPMGKKIAQGLYEATRVLFAGFKGTYPQVVRSLKELSEKKNITTSDLMHYIKKLQKVILTKGCKGICFIIDELGKFLEFEARHYGANDIYMLQALAEHACNGGECNIFLFVLLHQSFEQYAKGLGENLKNEWSKVQGRFEEVPFLETSEQVLKIVSAAFSYKMTQVELKYINTKVQTICEILQRNNALPGIMDIPSAVDLFSHCYPLHPVSAVLLPLLCQKVAQNERTLFNYLGSREEFGLQDMIEHLSSTEHFVLPHHIYDYFVMNQPAVLGDYHTHRRWVEVVTAVERLGDAPNDQVSLLKTIGILNIIGAKGGLKPSKVLLESCGCNKAATARALKALQDKSIITFRRFSGEYRVWQGSDFDLEQAVEEEINNIGEFSLAEELNRSNALMPIVARRYTIENGSLRYFIPVFVDAKTYRDSPPQASEPRVIFFLATAQDDEKIFYQSVINHYSSLDIIALCLNGAQLREAVAEVIALLRVQKERQELYNDPVAQREFEDRFTAAENAEQMLLQQLQERPQEWQWFYNAKQVRISTRRGLQELLSLVLGKVYNKAPQLKNELINRDRPTAQANAARNKLLEAMMLNPQDVDDLGIKKFPPEKAIYRSILRETGLHNAKKREFQRPCKSSTIFYVWKEIEKFLDETENEPKSFIELNDILMAPPYGVKAGVLSILYISAYIINQHELALYESRSYRPVMTNEMLERFTKRPDEFTFQRFRITGMRSSIYAEYCKLINTKSNINVVQIVKPLVSFINALPFFTRKTKSILLSDKSRKVRDAFDLAKSPESLIFKDIPKALGYAQELEAEEPNLEGLSQSIQNSLKELQDAYPKMIRQQIKMLLEAFHMSTKTDLASLRKKAMARYTGLEQHSVDVDGLKAFIKRITKREGDDAGWLENILMFLAQKPTKKWTDTDIAKADIKLSDFSKRILDLEELRRHYDDTKSSMDSEFDVILLKTIKRGHAPMNEVVAIDGRKKDIVHRHKTALLKALSSQKDTEVQFAALAEVVNDFLEKRQKSEPTNSALEKPKELEHGE